MHVATQQHAHNTRTTYVWHVCVCGLGQGRDGDVEGRAPLLRGVFGSVAGNTFHPHWSLSLVVHQSSTALRVAATNLDTNLYRQPSSFALNLLEEVYHDGYLWDGSAWLWGFCCDSHKPGDHKQKRSYGSEILEGNVLSNTLSRTVFCVPSGAAFRLFKATWPTAVEWCPCLKRSCA